MAKKQDARPETAEERRARHSRMAGLGGAVWEPETDPSISSSPIVTHDTPAAAPVKE